MRHLPMLLEMGAPQGPLEPPDELLRLLHVVPTYLPAVRYGGPIRSVHALCRGLAALGHESMSSRPSVDGPGDSDVPLGTPVDLEGVQVTYFPSRLLRRLYWSPPMRRALFARAADFDLVHLHAIYLWPTWAGARAARAARRSLCRLAARHARAGAHPPQEPLGEEAWIALIDRANVEGAAAIHATSASRPSTSVLWLVAAAGRYRPARRRRSAAGIGWRCRRMWQPRSPADRSCWRSGASVGRRGSTG